MAQLEKKYSIEGGRGGSITFEEGDRRGRLEWEMLVGELAMVIYAGWCRWVTPANQPMSSDEVRQHTAAFARESGLSLEIDFGVDGSEVVRPA